MRAHVIENGVVVDTILIDRLDARPNLVEATEGGIGWAYADGVFTAPPDTRTDEEIQASVRRQRDELLAECDWVTVKAIDQNAQDSLGIQIPQVWLDYRQALRDVPTQAGFPHTITWPTKPEV